LVFKDNEKIENGSLTPGGTPIKRTVMLAETLRGTRTCFVGIALFVVFLGP